MQNSGVEKLIKHLILSGDTSGLRELIVNPSWEKPSDLLVYPIPQQKTGQQ
mgnify:CR=1 FL=1|jgi:hypothetical protein